ncbi:hypothetical protein vBAcoSR7M_51 [Alteromonas phage vB_AcoS-R7M]|uniref:Uncharacterized protein n=1 Tax=Alteromonas phage vB_AcoS-R7M TaxID=2729541 RepID=A0A6M3YN91_9CAUD|nr:hypothetical protein HWD34_gp51 [Alteromonas phage vB_AcoS-R7M]QJI53373.1 hypothetical protein vBAcoSR7M_51 [Alteromonas phage vB_AcoS-R7M]
MYVLINLDTLRVLHKNENIFSLCNVAQIECKDSASWVVPCHDATFLKSFTHLELRMLYKNLTGVELADNVPNTSLIAVLFKTIGEVPVSPMVEAETERQSFYAEKNDGEFIYCHGAFKPAIAPDLFKPVIEHHEAIVKDAVSGKYNRELYAAVPRKVAKRVQPITTSSEGSPRRGTAKIIIWSVADSMWEAAGKPTEKGEVLKIRKAVMDKLETEEGIKRTSASSELGNWHKIRAPF